MGLRFLQFEIQRSLQYRVCVFNRLLIVFMDIMIGTMIARAENGICHWNLYPKPEASNSRSTMEMDQMVFKIQVLEEVH